MTKIQAFVGHSFIQQDADLVRQFTEYFDSLTKILSFTWINAKTPQPKSVSEKVRDLMVGKNVFIGICTRKEIVTSEPGLKLWGKFSLNKTGAASWKTSDWLIQEIGLALGLDLKIILLIEEGIRMPGALQSDLNYIVFNRLNPSGCFTELLQMLSNISPRAQADIGVVPGEQTQDVDSQTGHNKNDPIQRQPEPNWSVSDYRMAFMDNLLLKDIPAADKIIDAYIATIPISDENTISSWLAFCEYVKFNWGMGGTLSNLTALTLKYPANYEIFEYEGRAFEKYEDFTQAASSYERGAEKALHPSGKVEMIGLAARAYQKANNAAALEASTNAMKLLASQHDVATVKLVDALRIIADASKNDELSVAFMEYALAENPSNHEIRFALAYKYSGMEQEALSLFHYLRIPASNRNAMAWNNLGVSYSTLRLNAKAVEAWRKSKDEGETLAMSNLAHKFISAGFLKEAQEECEQALKATDYHENIPSTLALVKSEPERENGVEEITLERAQPKSQFYVGFGKAASDLIPVSFGNRWNGPECELSVKIHGSTILMEGSYEVEQSSFARLFTGGLGSPAKVKENIRFVGIITGRAIVAKLKRFKDEEEKSVLATTLLSGDDEITVLLFLSSDGRTVKVMEKSGPNGHSLQTYEVIA